MVFALQGMDLLVELGLNFGRLELQLLERLQSGLAVTAKNSLSFQEFVVVGVHQNGSVTQPDINLNQHKKLGC